MTSYVFTTSSKVKNDKVSYLRQLLIITLQYLNVYTQRTKITEAMALKLILVLLRYISVRGTYTIQIIFDTY